MSYMSQIEKLLEKLKQTKTDIPLRDLSKILTSVGYVCVRQKGSHFHFRKANSPFITVPAHQQKVKRVYIKEILSLLNL